jgi:hypothetical protein
MRFVTSVILGATLLVALPLASSAQTQKPQISDKAVSTLMELAWAITPAEYTRADGLVIKIDKRKFKENSIPVNDAREVVRVGRLSALAQLCELPDAQTANYEAFMAREQGKAKWSEQQLYFIHHLHLFTVLTMTGQVKGTEGEVAGPPKDAAPAKTQKCSDTERQRVAEQIAGFVQSGPGAPAKK